MKVKTVSRLQFFTKRWAKVADRDTIVDVLTSTAAPQLLVDEIYNAKWYHAGGSDRQRHELGCQRIQACMQDHDKGSITVFCELRTKLLRVGEPTRTIMRIIGGHDKVTVNKSVINAEMYHKPLIEDLDSELSGDFKDAVIQWVISRSRR